MNTTIASDLLMLLNQTGGSIPITLTTSTTTDWTQYITSIMIGSIFLLFYFGSIASIVIKEVIMKIKLKSLTRITKRHVILIKHTESSFFNMSMINQKTLSEIQKALLKFKGKPFDLILHTPGGEIFSAELISKILSTYPGGVRAFVQSFSMSGGTMLALSCNELYMGEGAVLGCTDPQIGNLFKYGSANSYDYIKKYKGKKAEDSTISFALLGRQYTNSIKEHLNKVINFPISPEQKGKLIDFLTNGKVEHAYQLDVGKLISFGIPVKLIPEKLQKKILKLLSHSGLEGVTYA